MYGVIINNGPRDWQIIQQHNGYAEIELSGTVEVEDEVINYEDAVVVVRVINENNATRVSKPVFVNLTQNSWTAKLRVPAGGPYRIETYLRFDTVCEKRGDRIFHLGVGDVYVITGQSNAVGVGKDSINDPISADVHMFRLCGNWDIASHPLHDSTDTKFPLSQEKTQTGHSPWLNFAKILSSELGYPIGLIPGTKGGIPLSYWDREVDGAFFNNMLEILKMSGNGTDIKGILWYQGCNDTDERLATDYFERFKRVCADFRNVFGGQTPIFTVQLNKVVCIKDQDTEKIAVQWSRIREAQRKAMHEIENLYLVPSLDCMVCDGIHNSCMSNMVIGQRTANLALNHVYGKTDIICDAPDIEKAVLESKREIRLIFNNVYDRLFSDYNCTDKLMFSLKDAKGRILPCDYRCDGDNSISLMFDRDIEKGATVSCDRYNDSGLMPYDLYSYLPVIAFNDIAVEG